MENEFSSKDIVKQKTSSCKTSLIELIDSVLLNILFIYLFSSIKGLPLMNNIAIYGGIGTVSSLGVLYAIRKLSIYKQREIHIEYQTRQSNDRDSLNRIVISVSTMFSIAIINCIYTVIFLILGFGFLSFLPSVFNYGLSNTFATVISVYTAINMKK